METTHHPRQPGELHRFPHRETGCHRQHPECYDGGVSMLLQGIVGFSDWWLGCKEEVVAYHGPHSGNIPRCKQDLFIVAAENLVAEIQQARADVDPHEGEVPLQCTPQPTTDGKRLGPVEQVLLRDLRPKAREGAKDLQSTSHHHE